MDGSDKFGSIFSNIHLPSIIKLDLVNQQAYFMDDHLKTVGRIDYHGQNRILVVRQSNLIDFEVFERRLFYIPQHNSTQDEVSLFDYDLFNRKPTEKMFNVEKETKHLKQKVLICFFQK